APVVNAGSNQAITLPSTAALKGTASDDGLPAASTLKTTWSTVSGPGTVTFANASALSTTASFSTSGSYVLRLTASDGSQSSSGDVTITVNPGSTAGTLAAAYSFDEGSGTIASDASGTGLTGTLAGGAAWTAGKHGNAVSLDGLNAYVDLGNPVQLRLTGSM